MTRAFLTLLLFLLVGTPSYALTIHEARVGVHPDKTRLVFDLSQPQTFRAFTLENPYRLVIDLPTFTWNASGLDSSPNSGIKALRHGNLKPGISRIVLDLKNPITIQKAFTLPKQSGKPNRLVLDYTPSTQTAFNQSKSQIFGTLDINNPPTSTQTASIQTFKIPTPSEKPSPHTPAAKPLIIIDPGHGGVDPGAIGKNKVYEKDIVLKLAKELRKQLHATGRYRVKMTRETDKFIRLRNRVKFARQHEGDLFVSIHADSIDKSHVQGASVYTLSEKASDAQTAKLAARENKADLIAGIDLNEEDEDVANILMDLATRDTMNQSNFFADKLSNVFKKEGVKTLKTTHRSAGFAVLKAPDIPSILVEAGFMSNKQEANRLNTPAYRKKVATALRRGIDKYFEQVRKNERI